MEINFTIEIDEAILIAICDDQFGVLDKDYKGSACEKKNKIVCFSASFAEDKSEFKEIANEYISTKVVIEQILRRSGLMDDLVPEIKAQALDWLMRQHGYTMSDI